jgi:hypothetical protein
MAFTVRTMIWLIWLLRLAVFVNSTVRHDHIAGLYNNYRQIQYSILWIWLLRFEFLVRKDHLIIMHVCYRCAIFFLLFVAILQLYCIWSSCNEYWNLWVRVSCTIWINLEDEIFSRHNASSCAINLDFFTWFQRSNWRIHEPSTMQVQGVWF